MVGHPDDGRPQPLRVSFDTSICSRPAVWSDHPLVYARPVSVVGLAACSRVAARVIGLCETTPLTLLPSCPPSSSNFKSPNLTPPRPTSSAPPCTHNLPLFPSAFPKSTGFIFFFLHTLSFTAAGGTGICCFDIDSFAPLATPFVTG